MPRTFSLARLMVGITVLCALLGLAVCGSEELQAFVLLFALLSPTAIVYLTLVSFARNRSLFWIGSVVGMLMCSPLGLPAVMHMGPGPLIVWDAVVGEMLPVAVGLSLSALFTGCAMLFFERYSQQATPADERLDQKNEIHRLLRR